MPQKPTTTVILGTAAAVTAGLNALAFTTLLAAIQHATGRRLRTDNWFIKKFLGIGTALFAGIQHWTESSSLFTREQHVVHIEQTREQHDSRQGKQDTGDMSKSEVVARAVNAAQAAGQKAAEQVNKWGAKRTVTVEVSVTKRMSEELPAYTSFIEPCSECSECSECRPPHEVVGSKPATLVTASIDSADLMPSMYSLVSATHSGSSSIL